MTNRIEDLFARAFAENHHTRLQGGAEEPLYSPGEGGEPHTIHYREDYLASALHEIAHWCVAGSERRQQIDYGYWYAADGRSVEQQTLFEQHEVRPQAMEWVFNQACGETFRVSADNLELGLGPSEAFKAAIFQQVQVFCSQGLPERASRFVDILSEHFTVENPLASGRYCLEDL